MAKPEQPVTTKYESPSPGHGKAVALVRLSYTGATNLREKFWIAKILLFKGNYYVERNIQGSSSIL
jgi:hypothetical protein